MQLRGFSHRLQLSFDKVIQGGRFICFVPFSLCLASPGFQHLPRGFQFLNGSESEQTCSGFREVLYMSTGSGGRKLLGCWICSAQCGPTVGPSEDCPGGLPSDLFLISWYWTQNIVLLCDFAILRMCHDSDRSQKLMLTLVVSFFEMKPSKGGQSLNLRCDDFFHWYHFLKQGRTYHPGFLVISKTYEIWFATQWINVNQHESTVEHCMTI